MNSYERGMDMLWIKNGRLINPATDYDEKVNILIDEGKISKITSKAWEEIENEIKTCKNDEAQMIDAEGCIVAPGLVDVHVHFRDPGFTYKEDIETGARAALKGGFTSVVLMANTKPTVDNEETLAYVLEKGEKTDLHVYSCAAVTKGLAGKELVDMDTLLAKGAAGFTDDGIPIMDEALLENAMKKAAELGVPVSLHEEDASLITNNGVNRGKASEHYGIGGSPREAEISLIKRDLEVALRTGAILNVQHISSKEGVELVRQAKKRSEKGTIHAEATPHHFSLNEEAVIKYGTLAKMNPPLREETDRLAIIEGLKDGTIDIIATDHAPHSTEEKEKPLTEAPSGIIGLETALSLGVTNLVHTGELSMSKLLAAMTCNPARMYGLDAGTIEEGKKADIVIFSEDEEWIVGDYESKSTNSPFTGMSLKGVVKHTIVDGKLVYSSL